MKFQNELKNRAFNGNIGEKSALIVAKRIDDTIEEIASMLKRCHTYTPDDIAFDVPGSFQDQINSRIQFGMISEADATVIAAAADELIKGGVEKLEKCKKQTGMFLGGEISMLISQISGIRFNEKEFFHERLPDGQE